VTTVVVVVVAFSAARQDWYDMAHHEAGSKVAVVKVHTSLPHSSPSPFSQALTVLARVVFSAELVVDNLGGPGLFTTIQEAINAADPNDTILVHKNSNPAGWQGQIDINKAGLTIKGEDPVAASKAYFIGNRGGDNSKHNDQCGILCTIWKVIVKIFHFLTLGLFEGAPTTAAPTGAPTPDDGLEEVFCPDTILDGDDDTIILVSAPNVIIENFTFRFGRVRFGTGSDDSMFRDNCYFPYSGDSLTTPDGLRNSLVITNNQFFNGIQATMYLACTFCTINHNTLLLPDNGIFLQG
jgi:hypothetical protein